LAEPKPEPKRRKRILTAEQKADMEQVGAVFRHGRDGYKYMGDKGKVTPPGVWSPYWRKAHV
jgi:hypothetical protein